MSELFSNRVINKEYQEQNINTNSQRTRMKISTEHTSLAGTNIQETVIIMTCYKRSRTAVTFIRQYCQMETLENIYVHTVFTLISILYAINGERYKRS
jgi:hypothetical protein